MEYVLRRRDTRTWALGALFFCTAALSAASSGPVGASPWVEAGDDVLRRDVEIVAGYGLIDGLTTTWPIPWRQVSKAFSRAEERDLPPTVRHAISRLRSRYRYEVEPNRARLEARAQIASEPRLVRGFRDAARDEIDVEAGVEYMWNSTAVRLNAGGLSDFKFDDVSANLDRSYIAQEVGGWLLYAGTLEEWWGGGNLGSLIRSNNARPHPRVGLMRNDPKAFESPWLSWIGPWQFTTAMGLFDDDRTPDHPLVWDMRLSVAPLNGLEVALMKTVVLCGEDMPCDGDVWWQAFQGKASGEDPNALGGGNSANTLAGADIRYSVPIGDTLFALYGQYMGEDSNNGWPGKASYLAGASLAGYSTSMSADWQLTGEIADTRGKLNGGNTPDDNRTYDHSVHREGYRYRGRTLGHSLDNQAILYSVAGLAVDRNNWRWRAALHRAELNQLDRPTGNTVSRTAEDVHVAELGVEIPWGPSLVSLDIAVQDDQPDSPGEKDWLFSAFGSWRVRF